VADDETQDWAEFARAMQQNRRGANDYWYWRDKPEMERGAVRGVLEQAGLDVQRLRSRGRGDDPPDCEAMIGGLLCGIEVTELIATNVGIKHPGEWAVTHFGPEDVLWRAAALH
jgi:hypothetical protein